MKPECIKAVNAIYGREATPAQIEAIETRLSRTMRQLGARDPLAWQAKSADDRLTEATAEAAREIVAEAELRQRRQALQILAVSKLQQAMASIPGVTPLEALGRLIAFHSDARGSVQSLETRVDAIQKDALRQMLQTMEATEPRLVGLWEDAEGVRNLVRELHGEKTGDTRAAVGAAKFKEIAEALRQRYNRSGSDVGRLEDWGMPHHHSQIRVARAGRGAWLKTLSTAERAKAVLFDTPPPKEWARDHWVADLLPRLNRSRYVREDGSRMGEAELTELLQGIWLTISTGGLNKTVPGQHHGSGARANRGGEARQIHFKDADAYLDYQNNFGEKTAYEVLIDHIESVSRDIAAVEMFGPNPDHVFRLLSDQAAKQMAEANPAGMGTIKKQQVTVENYFNHETGRTLPVASERLARTFDAIRNSLVSNRLGSAFLTSITDEGTMMRMASVNNLPQMQLWRNELKAMNLADREEKRLANRAGLGLNTMIASLNRFGNQSLGSGWTSKIAMATLRASGLTAITESRRRAWGATYMSAVGQVAKTTRRLADLDPTDHRILLSKGITEMDFAVWKRAELEDWGDGNDTMLTPDAIYRIPDEALADLGNPTLLREEAATKLLGATLEETNMAVIEPGTRERAMMGANLQRGTWKGELTRSVFLFKSFPIAMIFKHWQRALSEPTGVRRTRAMVALTTSTTLLGMVALQASMLRDGKDPLTVKDGRTWMAALLKGGALSIFGDFLFAKETEHGRGALATLLGPVAGLTEEALALTWGNLLEASKGEETDAGAEAIKFAKGNTPVVSALLNLWYTRAIADHLLVHDLQEAANPGYLRRMENRAQNEFGQDYWWRPGEAMPERAPELEAVVEEPR